MMTRIFLIRHAESEWNRVGKIQGQSDPGLTEEGLIHAKCLAHQLKQESIEIIYTSHLKRAKGTARVLSDALKVPVIEDKGLAEIRFGVWEGKTYDEINKLYRGDYDKWLKASSKVSIPGAEELSEFRQRAKKSFEAILKKDNGKNIAVVTHGGIIRSIVASILKAELDNLILALTVTDTAVTLIEYTEEPRIIYINNTSHLLDVESRLSPEGWGEL